MTNFLSHADTRLDLSDIHTAIVCGPNGHGKSAIAGSANLTAVNALSESAVMNEMIVHVTALMHVLGIV